MDEADRLHPRGSDRSPAPRWPGSCPRRSRAIPRLSGKRSASPATPPPGGSYSSPAAANPATSRPVRMIRCGSAAGSSSRRRSGRSIRRIYQADPAEGSAAGVPSISPTPCFRAFPRRAAPVPVFPLPLLPADDAEGRRRSHRVPAHAAGGSGPGAGERSRRFPFRSAAPWACGSSSISTIPAFAPIPGKASNGTAAAISSRAPAIAANVIPRAVSLARWTRAGRSPGRPCPTATANRRT